LPGQWFEGLAWDECDEDEMRWRTNSARAEAEAVAKASREWR